MTEERYLKKQERKIGKINKTIDIDKISAISGELVDYLDDVID